MFIKMKLELYLLLSSNQYMYILEQVGSRLDEYNEER